MVRGRGYSMEFRQEAVNLARSSDRTVAETAAELGLNRRTLYHWARQLDIDAGLKQGVTTEERTELVRLRRRVAVLEDERAILIKAAAFFAKETDATR
jgi:transposase